MVQPKAWLCTPSPWSQARLDYMISHLPNMMKSYEVEISL